MASTSGYERSLKLGYRSVELDCHDGNNGDPVVRHGPASTAIPVKNVLEVIAKNAFVTSDFAVCLSIENHCSLQQQARMARLLNDTFGKILISPDNPVKTQNRNVHPSPEEMKNCVEGSHQVYKEDFFNVKM